MGLKESDEEKSHASRLTVFIHELLDEHSLKASDLEAVAVSRGPGSYTGLRIGVSTAKGLAYALGIPLIGTDTLASLAVGARQQDTVREMMTGHPDLLLCPMLDARRMEVYTAIHHPDGKEIDPVSAIIIESGSFDPWLKDHTLLFFGNGSAKCRDIITHPHAVFVDGLECSAEFMTGLSETAFQQKNFENVAYFEPSYLKDFIATIPKRKVIK
jgi:tRNA threonylcarbamoyladenosine biosynthesis protein TsaB